MDLRTGALLWPHTSPKRSHGKPLDADVRCDVAVIGAGLSGAMVGCSLVEAGFDVVLLDKREPAQGSTAASTALVLYDLDTPLTELIAQSGRKRAFRSYQCCFEAIALLEARIRKLQGSCDFRSRPSLYLATRDPEVAGLRKECDARRRAGLKVHCLDRQEVKKHFGFSAPGAITSPHGAEINPVQLTVQLLRSFLEGGGRLFVPAKSCRITESARDVTVHTTHGRSIRARWLVVASGYETRARVARQRVSLKASYVLVTHPQRHFPHWPGRCLIWETRRPYFYLRSTVDNRIVIGGGDEKFRTTRERDRLLPEKTRQLQRRLLELFPAADARPAYAWTGIFGETTDSLPYIGPARSGSRVYYALCYGANGTNFAVLASEFLRDRICGRTNPDEALFSFVR